MRILIVSQYYPPETNAPANRMSKMAQVWARNGADVTVLTGFPNHPEGSIYPGYSNRKPQVEQHNGVRVVRVPIFVAANEGKVKRSLAYSSFALSGATIGASLVERPDVVVATSPQLLVAALGVWLAKLFRRPFVLDLRDLWPDSVVAVGAASEDSRMVRGLRSLEQFVYRHADHIVIVSEGFRPHLSRCGVSDDRISFVPNGVDAGLFAPSEPDPEYLDPDLFTLIFAGTVGLAHGIGTILDAAAQLRDERIRFLIVGSGAERAALEERAKAESLSNVHFLGRVPRERIPGLLAASDVALITLRPSPLFTTVLPSKMFEAMGCATPIFLAVDGEARRLLEKSEAGIFIEPGSSEELVKTIQGVYAAEDQGARDQQLKTMGDAGRAFVLESFEREALAAGYFKLLQGIR